MGKVTEEMLTQIKKDAEALGRAPLRRESKVTGSIRGGWTAAVRLAGLCPYDGYRKNDVRPPQNGVRYTDEELIGFVREAADVLGRAPGKSYVPEYAYVEYRFGPWHIALENMGYEVLETEYDGRISIYMEKEMQKENIAMEG